jgi:hypothetical protein
MFGLRDMAVGRFQMFASDFALDDRRHGDQEREIARGVPRRECPDDAVRVKAVAYVHGTYARGRWEAVRTVSQAAPEPQRSADQRVVASRDICNGWTNSIVLPETEICDMMFGNDHYTTTSELEIQLPECPLRRRPNLLFESFVSP